MRRSTLTLAVVAVMVAVTAVAAHAAAGGLDPSFSGDGKAITSFGGPTQRAEGVVILPDDRVVAVGTRGPATGPSQFALARYRASGTLDTSFGGDGKVTTGFSEGPAGAYDVALAGNGDYLVVGYAGLDRRFAVARYNPNGTLDTTFSGDGKRTISFGGDYAEALGVAITPAGKIVVVGSSSVYGYPSGIAVARLTAAGALDTSFSTDGKVVTGLTDHSNARDVALAGGKVVVVGNGIVSGVARFLVLQLTSTGEPDPEFGGGDGWTTTRFGSVAEASSAAYAVQIRPDGRLVVAGQANLAGTPDRDFAVARYLPNGALDDGFSGNGKATHHFGDGLEHAEDLALQPDGKIVLAGVSKADQDAPEQWQALVRLHPDGSRDLAFSGDGLKKINVSAPYEYEGAQDVGIDGAGRIVAVGSGLNYDTDPDGTMFSVVRVQGN